MTTDTAYGFTAEEFERQDVLARNVASELALGDDAQVLVVLKTGLALAYSNGKRAAQPAPSVQRNAPVTCDQAGKGGAGQ